MSIFRIILLGCLMTAYAFSATAAPAPAAERVLRDEFFEAAEQYVLSHAPWKGGDVSLKRNYVHEMKVPMDADITIKTEAFRHSKAWGKILVPVSVLKDGKPWRRVSVYLNVNKIGTVAMALKNIRYHEQLSSANTKLVRMPLSRVPHTAILEQDVLAGSRAKCSIPAGSVVTTTMVEARPLVRRGEPVTMIIKTGGLAIRTAGRAKDDGLRGERVRVVNTTSNKTVYAVVTGKGTVEISH